MDPTPDTTFLTSQQVAALLRVHPKHIYRLLKRGLPGHRVGGTWRFDRAAVLAWSGAAVEVSPSSAGVSATVSAAAGTQASLGTAGPLLAANGDLVVVALLDCLNAAPGPLWGFVQADRAQALAWLGSGRVTAAGSHGSQPPPVVAGQRLTRIHLALRRVGLAVRPGREVPAWGALGRVRVAGRPETAGVHGHLMDAVRAAGVDPAAVRAATTEHSSHRAVVGAVLRGEADVGLTTEAWALATGLTFVPIATERYGLLVRSADLGTPAVVRLCEAAQSAQYAASLARVPGYDLTRVGEIRYDPQDAG